MACEQGSRCEGVWCKRMKELVPEYRSHNSVYSNFDTPPEKA